MKKALNFKYLIRGLILTLIMTLILILIVSFLLRFTNLAEAKLSLINNVIMVLSIALGSGYLAIKIKEKGWLFGALLGLIYYCLLLVLNIIFFKINIFKLIYIMKLMIAMLIGAIGGIIGINLI